MGSRFSAQHGTTKERLFDAFRWISPAFLVRACQESIRAPCSMHSLAPHHVLRYRQEHTNGVTPNRLGSGGTSSNEETISNRELSTCGRDLRPHLLERRGVSIERATTGYVEFADPRIHQRQMGVACLSEPEALSLRQCSIT